MMLVRIIVSLQLLVCIGLFLLLSLLFDQVENLRVVAILRVDDARLDFDYLFDLFVSQIKIFI